MTYSRISRWIAIPAIAMALAVSAFGADPVPSTSAGGLLGLSKPSENRTLSFNQPGRVAKVLVKKDDPVKAGQLVAQLDDEEQQAALEIDRVKSEDTTSVDAEKAVRADKDAQYQKMLAKGPAMAQTELDAARMEVVVADARIKLAEATHQEDILKYKQTIIAVKKLELHSPIDGVVAETFLDEGESADGGNMRVMRVIQVDPLWVEVPVPIVQASHLKKGDLASVVFPDKTTRNAEVDLISPDNDAGSQRRVIRLTLPNPEKLPPSEVVTVYFGTTGLAKN